MARLCWIHYCWVGLPKFHVYTMTEISRSDKDMDSVGRNQGQANPRRQSKTDRNGKSEYYSILDYYSVIWFELIMLILNLFRTHLISSYLKLSFTVLFANKMLARHFLCSVRFLFCWQIKCFPNFCLSWNMWKATCAAQLV